MVEYNVSADLKLYLDDVSNMENVKKSVEKLAKVSKFWEEDVGFGIKVLKATILMNDDQGGMDQLESKLREVEHISEVEVENISRV